MDNQIGQLFRRVQLMAGIGRTTAPAKDDGNIQTQQVRLKPDGAVRDGSMVLSMFGFSSHAPVGSDVLVLFLGGDRSKGVVIGTANQPSRFKNLGAGEQAVFNAHGMSVHLSAGGVVIDCGGKTLAVRNGSKARFEMPIESTGEITAQADGAAVHVSTHLHPDAQGGNVGLPKG